MIVDNKYIVINNQGDLMASIQDLVDLELQEPVSSYIKSRRQEIYQHNVYLDEDIGDPAKYRDLINMLYLSDDNSEFNFLLNTAGGQLSACMAIVEGIRETDAFVRCIINGECHSAGSIIALNCHEVIVTPAANMMIHTANFGSVGSTPNVKAHTDFSTLYINKIIDTTYAGFLTPSEINDVKKGMEIWLDADEITRRCKNRQDSMTKKIAEIVKKKKKTEKEAKLE